MESLTHKGLAEKAKVVLTDRDIEIFRFLNEQIVMVSGQIYQIFWPESETRSGTARQRLTKLVEAGYLKIHEAEIKYKKLRLFLLTPLGLDELKKRKLDHGLSVVEDIGSLPVEHSLKLVNIRAVFQSLGQHDWKCERLIRNDPRRSWYPDGILKVNGLQVAIELENTFKVRDRYVQRFKKYQLDKEFRLVIFVICWPSVKSWLLDLDAPQSKICFVDYNDLMKKKERATLENKTSEVLLSEFLS